MAAKKKSTTKPARLPREGGRYLREPDGSLNCVAQTSAAAAVEQKSGDETPKVED